MSTFALINLVETISIIQLPSRLWTTGWLHERMARVLGRVELGERLDRFGSFLSRGTLLSSFVLLGACSAMSPSIDAEEFEGMSLAGARAVAEDYGLRLVPQPDCEFAVRNGGEPTVETWVAPEEIPTAFESAIEIESVVVSDPEQVMFCGFVELSRLPVVDETTIDLMSAQQLCSQAKPLLTGAMNSRTPNELKDGLSLPNLQAMRVNAISPQFYPIHRYYFSAWSMVDFVEGLNWLEWVSQSSEAVMDQTISSLDAVVRRNGNLTVITSWREAVESLKSSQAAASAMCAGLSNLIARPQGQASTNDSGSIIGITTKLPDITPLFLEVSPDGMHVVAASSKEVAILGASDLSIRALLPLGEKSPNSEISALAIDESSTFLIVAMANNRSSELVRIDLTQPAVQPWGTVLGRVDAIYVRSDGFGVLGVCKLGEFGRECGISARSDAGVQEIQRRFERTSDADRFGGFAYAEGSNEVLVGAPNGVLYRTNIATGLTERALRERIFTKGNSVLQSPSGGSPLVAIDLNDPVIGPVIEVREFVEGKLGPDLWGQVPGIKYPVDMHLTSVPGQLAYFGTRGIGQQWEWDDNVREFVLWDTLDGIGVKRSVTVGNGTRIPPFAPHPTLPVAYVATSNSLDDPLADTNVIKVVGLLEQ